MQFALGVAGSTEVIDVTSEAESAKLSPRLAIGIAIWLAAVAAGTVAMLRYSTTPGDTGDAPSRWPSRSSLPTRDGEASLVMFVHPHCPCSRASLGELSRLMTRLHGQVRPVVVMIRPEGEPGNWERTDLWDLAELVTDARIVVDADGGEAERFGAQTSGHVVLYDRDGTLRFSGGITPGRSHNGDSFGRKQILAWFESKKAPEGGAKSAVFGCGLLSRAEGDQR